VSYRVGVLGATGAVGSTILQVLAEREFPVSELVPLASNRSAGRRVKFGSEQVVVIEVSDESIQGLDIVLSSAGGSVSAEWAPKIVEAGAVVVDNTSFWRMHPDVPLVVSEVNPDAVDDHSGLIANPNCTTMQMMVALAPIQREIGIKRLVVSTYQSVSGTGQKAIDELYAQTRAVLDGETPEAHVYPHPIAFNVVPQVETFKPTRPRSERSWPRPRRSWASARTSSACRPPALAFRS
jgi:aspartate-semialdehyde dehydrogenase